MPNLVDIGIVRERTGLTASALRFYEERGLISSVERVGLRRQYEPEVIDQVAVIVLCRESGFTLAEIGVLLATKGAPAWKDIAQAKAQELRSSAERLTAIADQLDHATQCPSPNLMQCEHFRAVLDTVLTK